MCRLAPAHLLSATDSVTRAVRCAESFIVEQGFTDRAVTDTSAIVWDILDRLAESSASALAQRRFSLGRDAYGICVNPNQRSGYMVVFRSAAAPASDSTGRAVWMSRAFSDMRVVHQDIRLAAVQQRQVGCRPLSSVPTRRQQN